MTHAEAHAEIRAMATTARRSNGQRFRHIARESRERFAAIHQQHPGLTNVDALLTLEPGDVWPREHPTWWMGGWQ